MTVSSTWRAAERWLHQAGLEPELVVLGGAGVMGAALGGAATHAMQKAEERIFPCLYSGVARLSGTTTEVDYYAAVNDMVMSFTAAWNARPAKESASAFLKRLKASELGASARQVQVLGEAFLKCLETHQQLLKCVREAERLNSALWTYRKHDNYRTETYTVTTTDSKGRTRTQTRTRRVYEDTDHWFTFFPQNADPLEVALDQVSFFKAEELYSPALSQFKVQPARASSNRGGPYRSAQAITSSRGKLSEEAFVKQTILEDEDADIDADDIRDWLNAWLESARVTAAIQEAHQSLRRLSEKWKMLFRRARASTQRRYHYKTRTRSHSGPDGYGASQELAACMLGISRSLSGLFGAISDVEMCARHLERLGSGEAPAGWKSQDKDIARWALDHAVEAYVAAFPDSPIEMDQRSSTKKTLLGVAVGAAVGLALSGAFLFMMS